MSNEWHQSKQSTVRGGRWRRSCGDPSLSTHLCDWLWPLAEAALSHPPLFSPHLSSCGIFFSSTGTWPVFLSEFGFFFFPPSTSAMLRVVVESASGIPKKKLGNPDPFAALVFRGEECCGFVCLFIMFPKRNVCVDLLQLWGLFLVHAAVSVLRI